MLNDVFRDNEDVWSGSNTRLGIYWKVAKHGEIILVDHPILGYFNRCIRLILKIMYKMGKRNE